MLGSGVLRQRDLGEVLVADGILLPLLSGELAVGELVEQGLPRSDAVVDFLHLAQAQLLPELDGGLKLLPADFHPSIRQPLRLTDALVRDVLLAIETDLHYLVLRVDASNLNLQLFLLKSFRFRGIGGIGFLYEL